MKKIVFEKLVILNTIFNLFLISSVLVGGFVWADSNGVWHRAEDVLAGTFGGDEGRGNYTFPDELNINGNLKIDGKINCVNCISQTNIKQGEVTSEGIKDLGINSNDLAEGSVTSEKLDLQNGIEVKSGNVDINGKTTSDEFCLGTECHSSWEGLCSTWITQNAIN